MTYSYNNTEGISVRFEQPPFIQGFHIPDSDEITSGELLIDDDPQNGVIFEITTETDQTEASISIQLSTEQVDSLTTNLLDIIVRSNDYTINDIQ